MITKSIKQTARRLLASILEEALDRDSKNIERHLRRQAALESAQFVSQHMAGVSSFSNAFDLLEYAISKIDLKTDDLKLICEFGVATGKTINFIGKLLPNLTIFGFDSFEGGKTGKTGTLVKSFQILYSASKSLSEAVAWLKTI
jgi:hypothetical protein